VWSAGVVAAWTAVDAKTDSMLMTKIAMRDSTAGFACFLRFMECSLFPELTVFISLSLPEFLSPYYQFIPY